MLWVPASPQTCQSITCLCSSPSAVLSAVGRCGNPQYCQLQGRHISSSHPNPSSITCMVVAEEDGGLDEPYYNLFASAGSLCYQFMSHTYQDCIFTVFFFKLCSCSLSSVGDHLLLLLSSWAVVILLPKHPPFSPPLLSTTGFPPYTHTFSPQAHPGSVRAGHNDAYCRLGWKCETLKTKLGKALKLKLQGLVLSPADLICM